MYKNAKEIHCRKRNSPTKYWTENQSRYCSKAEMQMNRYLKTSSTSLVAMEMQSKITKSYYATRVRMPIIKMTKASVEVNVE